MLAVNSGWPLRGLDWKKYNTKLVVKCPRPYLHPDVGFDKYNIKADMLSTAINLPTRRVFIYENSRYNPVTGWSTRGLLPTDRKALSNRDGSEGYLSLEDASEALASKGWVWDADSVWQVELTLSDVDPDGYSYSVDFQHFNGDNSPDALTTCGGSAQKTMIHFVRRRRLARVQYFDLSSIADGSKFTCDHCDLQEVEKLLKVLLDKLTSASISRHPRSISERKINALRNEMLNALQLLTPSSGSDASSVSSTAAAGASTKDISMTPYFFNKVSEILDNLITRSRTALSMASSVFSSGDTVDNWNQRQQEIARQFAYEERYELAKLIIRQHDVEYNYHCTEQNCGSSCIFAIETCPNVGCGVLYSRKWATQHDDICPEKILSCPRICGEHRMRKQIDDHLVTDCILRPIKCPYHGAGCVKDLVFKDLELHLETNVQHHMNLMFERLMSQQTVIASLHQQVQLLESARREQQQEIVNLSAALAAATLALKASEVQQEKAIKDEVSRVDNRLSRQITGLQTDISQIRGVLPRK